MAAGVTGAVGTPPRALAAQALSGQVVDAVTRRPVVAAPVRLLRAVPGDARASADTTPLASGVTAPDGVFTLAAPGPGSYRVRIGDAFFTPVATLASVDSVDMREYRLAAPTAPSVVAMSSPTAVDTAACRGAVRCGFQVEKQAATVPGTLHARYPAYLRGRPGVGDGRVTVQFVVDTSGHADMAKFRVLEASNQEFVPEVRLALARAQFYPAEVAHRHVRQLVQLPFTFALVRDSKEYTPPLFGPPFKPLPARTGFP